MSTSQICGFRRKSALLAQTSASLSWLVSISGYPGVLVYKLRDHGVCRRAERAGGGETDILEPAAARALRVR